MFTLMAQKMTSLFIKKGIIEKDDQEIYDYSFEILFSTLIELVFILLTALITNRLLETLFFLAGFIPMRRIAGGYHAKTHFRCFCLLTSVYYMFLMILNLLNSQKFVFVIIPLLLTNLILIFFLAPVEDKNRPISKEERIAFQAKSRLFIYLYSAALIAFLFVSEIFTLCVSLGVFAVASSLLAAKFRNRIAICKN